MQHLCGNWVVYVSRWPKWKGWTDLSFGQCFGGPQMSDSSLSSGSADAENLLRGSQLWRANRSSVVLQEWDPSKLLSNVSLPIFKGADYNDEGRSLQLFKSMTIQFSTTLEEEDHQSWLLDGVGFAGGRVWAMDWTPDYDIAQEQELHRMEEHFAVSVHNKDNDRNIIGEPKHGTGLIQIWSVSQADDSGKEGQMEMKMAILHEGAVTWDLQWCPGLGQYTAENKSRNDDYNLLGIMVAALGNGEVHFMCVPMPDEVELEYGKSTETPLAVAIKPSVILGKEDMQGSIVSSVDWLPSSPYDLVLLGCWNGFISIWQLPLGNRNKPQILIYHRCEVLAIRRVIWLKPQEGEEEEDIFRYTFCTGGHSGVLNVWDMRSIYEPQFSRMLARAWVLDIMATSVPRSLYAALEDSTFRRISLEASTSVNDLKTAHIHGNSSGAIWAMSCSEDLKLGVYGGEDGEIGVFELTNDEDSRRKKPHLCLGALKSEYGGIRALSAKEILESIEPSYNGFYQRKMRGDTTQGRFVGDKEVQLIQCLEMSPNGKQATWVAAGTASGLIRLTRIAS